MDPTMLKRQRTFDPTAAWFPESLTEDPSTWVDQSLVSVEQMSPGGVRLVMDYAERCRRLIEDGPGHCGLLQGKIMAAVFYEASTRTACSFHAAMLRLGGSVIPLPSSSSSVSKGESLADTIRCLECYCDVLVLRHPDKGSCDTAARAASIPVLNAGDGTGEHPTQALLDVYTMRAELGGDAPQDCTVTLAGDLKHGRTVHSLAVLLARAQFGNLSLRYIAPPSLEMPDGVKAQVAAAGVDQTEVSTLAEGIRGADVLYVTRIQKERFDNESDYHDVKGSYVLTPAIMKDAKEKMAVMHPLPRVDEIHTDVDDDPRAAYFRQMRNGMYVRMALLLLTCGKIPPLSP
uniref:aspartate carbamoyltransferase n=1 Tax=Phaeomonas parva TaxID=124430 RepID=A0A7S1XNR3_9STRA